MPFQSASTPAATDEKETKEEKPVVWAPSQSASNSNNNGGEKEKEEREEEDDPVVWGPFQSASSLPGTSTTRAAHKGNYSSFERQHYARRGWLDPSAIVDEFPAARLDPGDVRHTIPPLYHGTDEAAAASISQQGFRLKPTPAVGRSMGNGIYATPYLATAAAHGFGAALTYGNPGFAVGALGALKPMPSPRILVHDIALEDRLVGEMKKLPRARNRSEKVARERKILARLLPDNVVEVAIKLALTESASHAEKSGASLTPPDELSIDRIDISEAARLIGYDVVVYVGRPPDIVYLFLDAQRWTIGDIVFTGKVGAADEGIDVQDLDWYHAATSLDIRRETEQSKKK
jgi:hypothetical protein